MQILSISRLISSFNLLDFSWEVNKLAIFKEREIKKKKKKNQN